MKKPIIKNWIKYWTTTLAVSGLLVMGACGDNNETAQNETEAAETEVVAPARENVAAVETETEVTQEEPAETEESPQKVTTSSNYPSTYIEDMDAHIEEHKEVNKKIKETLTGYTENQNQEQRTPEYGEDGNITQTRGENQNQEQRTPEYGEDGNVTQTRGENQNQEMRTDQNLNNSQNNTNTEGSEDQTGQSGNMNMNQDRNNQNTNQPASATGQQNNSGMNQNQQVRPGNDQQTGTVEYDTDQQGNTEMEIDNKQKSPSGNTTPNQDQETQRSADPTQQDASLENKVNQDTANIYDRQSNTAMDERPDAYFMVLEEIATEYDPQGRQAIEDVKAEYNERRESMRGKLDPATNAYASPEVDPQPKQGTDQIMDKIQNNLEYPQNAAAAEIEGTVFVNFIVDETGKIVKADAVPDLFVPENSKQYTQPLNPNTFSPSEIEEAKKEMMEEAVKAVKATSGQWEPGMNNGEAVKAELQVPVVFNLENTGGTEQYTPEPLEGE